MALRVLTWCLLWNVLHSHKAWLTHYFGYPLNDGILGRDDDPTFPELVFSMMRVSGRRIIQIFAEIVGKRQAAKKGTLLYAGYKMV